MQMQLSLCPLFYPISLMTLRPASIITAVGRATWIRTPDGAVTACLSGNQRTAAGGHMFTTAVIAASAPSASHQRHQSGFRAGGVRYACARQERVPLRFSCRGLIGPCDRCHTIKLKLNAQPAKEKHSRANHDTTELKHLGVCVCLLVCVCVSTSAHIRAPSASVRLLSRPRCSWGCWRSAWGWPHLTTSGFRAACNRESIYPSWLRQTGQRFLFF